MAKPNKQFKLFLGRTTKHGRIIQQESFKVWQRDYLDRQFPDGYTLHDATGHWEGQTESSIVLTVAGWDWTEARVIEAGLAYKETFAQESVLLVAHKIEAQYL